jgi:hypothetical protein
MAFHWLSIRLARRNALTVGLCGPLLLQNVNLIKKLIILPVPKSGGVSAVNREVQHLIAWPVGRRMMTGDLVNQNHSDNRRQPGLDSGKTSRFRVEVKTTQPDGSWRHLAWCRSGAEGRRFVFTSHPLHRIIELEASTAKTIVLSAAPWRAGTGVACLLFKISTT